MPIGTTPAAGWDAAGSIGSAGTQWDDPNVGYYTWAGGYNTIALGLASFAMGVMQGLHARDTMKNFDYLSTVSGGGGARPKAPR